MADVYDLGQVVPNDKYSVTEVKTNSKWINGKTIYRRVCETLSPSTVTDSGKETSISFSFDDVEQITELRAFINDTANIMRVPYIASTNDWCGIYTRIGQNTIVIRASSTYGHGGKQTYVIVEYTKKSDSAS